MSSDSDMTIVIWEKYASLPRMNQLMDYRATQHSRTKPYAYCNAHTVVSEVTVANSTGWCWLVVYHIHAGWILLEGLTSLSGNITVMSWARWCLKWPALDGLLNRLFRRRSNKTSKARVTGLCEENSPHKRQVTRKKLYLMTSSWKRLKIT